MKYPACDCHKKQNMRDYPEYEPMETLHVGNFKHTRVPDGREIAPGTGVYRTKQGYLEEVVYHSTGAYMPLNFCPNCGKEYTEEDRRWDT